MGQRRLLIPFKSLTTNNHVPTSDPWGIPILLRNAEKKSSYAVVEIVKKSELLSLKLLREMYLWLVERD
ncbi:hypothetical protein evm_001582 [Chilo suppressalis]|nr:hypothetical protein evm_001582 [Chilo suppressalis]